MDNVNEFVPNVHFEQIPIKNLVSNQDYQRKLSPRHINRTVANFDLRQINPVKVSRRDGQNYVFNGQHTIEIIAMVSGSRETPVWCMVYDDLEYTSEADIFANQQKYVKPLSSYEIFIANVEADSDTHIVIKSLVENYGLTITSTRALCGVCAVSCLEQIFLKHGYHILDRTLKLVVSTWEGDMASLSASMLRGLAHLIVSYGDGIKDDLFADRIGAVSAREVTRTAKDRRAGSLGYAETMLLLYNKKAKAGLPMSRLYGSVKQERSTETFEADNEQQEALNVSLQYQTEQQNEMQVG